MANMQNDNSGSEHSFLGYVALCAIALLVAFGYMYLRNIGNTNFDRSSLKRYTCLGVSSKLEIDIPFDLTDGDTAPLDETGERMIYKIGASNNFRIELAGIRYNFNVNMLSSSDIMRWLTTFLEEDNTFSDIKKSAVTNATVNGIACARQTVNFFDKSIGVKLESKLVLFKKNDEIWMISIAYKEADKTAANFAETIINCIEVK